jgi:hypothetical protein
MTLHQAFAEYAVYSANSHSNKLSISLVYRPGLIEWSFTPQVSIDSISLRPKNKKDLSLSDTVCD